VLHPPKPRLTLRVGITGHRPNKLHGAAADRIQRQLPSVFSAIDTAAKEILAANGGFYADEPPSVRLVSGFAEGADQMAVAACPPGWKIEAILPFPTNEYLNDFARSAAEDGRDVRDAFKDSLKKANAVTQLAFSPWRSEDRGHADQGADTGKRDLGYADAGGYLLRQVDVLVAVWDGKAPKIGGTGAIARMANDKGIPVVWLSTIEDAAPRLITEFAVGGAMTTGADCTKGPLLTALLPVFAAPVAAAGRKEAQSSAPTGLERFLQERWHPRCYFFVYDFLKRVASARLPRIVIHSRSFAERCQDWDKFMSFAPETGDRSLGDADEGDLRSKLKSVLLERFVWADALAEHYSQNYRSTYVLAYLFSALAVFIALGSAIFANPRDIVAELSSAAFELVAIVAIVSIVSIGRFLHWHERWIEYRALAESLRHGRFLAFISEFGRIYDAAGGPGHQQSSWMLWYIRATMREIGLPTATLDHTYQWLLLQATLKTEIEGDDGQIAYHQGNQKIMGRIDHLLHYLGLICFGTTFCLLGLFIAGGSLDLIFIGSTTWFGTIAMELQPHLVFWTAGLPALGAALAGIRGQGDFEGSKERSARMFDALLTLQDDYRSAMQRDLSLSETTALLISTAHAMSEDVAAWQELYGRKWLTLPT
jgi:hypothetical protein